MAKNFRQNIKGYKEFKGADEENIKKQMGRYGRMSEEQLMAEMRRVAEENKRNGTLNAEELENFYNSASPMLTPQQRNRMRALINSLK